MSFKRGRVLFLMLSFLLFLLCVRQPSVPPASGETPLARKQFPMAAAPAAQPEILLTAHRGDSAHCPENTMAAFQSAADAGAGCLELDIQETADHVFVVCHDESLLRTAGVDRVISELRYEELQRMDVGGWYSDAFCGQCIPTLAEVLSFAKGRGVSLNIEIKAPLASGSEAALISLLRRRGMERQCVLASQNYGILERVKAHAPEIRTLYVTEAPPSDLRSLTAADGISVAYPALSAELLRQAHACGKSLHVWTVNTPEALRRAIALRPDALITDNPALARRLLDAG